MWTLAAPEFKDNDKRMPRTWIFHIREVHNALAAQAAAREVVKYHAKRPRREQRPRYRI